MIALIILSVLLPQCLCESVVLLDLTPEEAQKLIAGRSLAVNYAPQLDEGPLAAPLDKSRKFYHHGNLIDNPNDFVQRTYEANQFHAQDGLGRSMFGYSDWNQGRLEARNANGEVRGSYKYVDPYGEDVVVNYWSDSLGFHQMDNRPKFVMNPVTETPEVQAARAAHEKAWAAAAIAARARPDPMSDVYNANSNKLDEEQSEADQAMEIISGVANQKKSVARFPNIPYTNNIKSDEEANEDEEGAFSHDSIVVQSVGEARENKMLAKIRNRIEEEEEVPSNPRGFFYNFDYPVQLILENSDERQQRSVPLKKGNVQISANDRSDLSSSLDAEVAEYKVVKRSENSEDAAKVKNELKNEAAAEEIVRINIEQRDETVEKGSQPTKVEKQKIVDTAADSEITIIQPTSKRVEAQIPVIVKIEPVEPSDSVLKSEMELRRLATNEDAIDGIHDAQVHRLQNA